MPKGLQLSLGLFACLAAAGLVVLWVTSPPPGVNQRGFARIQKGATLAQIEELLGPASTRHTDEIRVKWIIPNILGYGERWGQWTGKNFLWDGGDGSIVVFFDSSMKATGAACLFFTTPTETFPDKLRRWLGLPWW